MRVANPSVEDSPPQINVAGKEEIDYFIKNIISPKTTMKWYNSHKESGKMGKRIHLIANAHIDPVWLWKWDEGFSEVVHTFNYISNLMDVTAGSAIFYMWIEKVDKELFEKIKKRIKEKRWFIAGPWIVQPDCNIPSGESYIRHSLYGKRYFKEKFGIDINIGFNPDSFGHNGNLPQILKKSGIDYYVFCRPGEHEKKLPQIFWWEGPDGSKVLASKPPVHYTYDISKIKDKIKHCSENFFEGVNDVVCFFGVGNHGGGPTKESIRIIKKLQEKKNLPELKFSSLNDFFKNIKGKNFSVIKDELQHHARGCYTSFSQIKRANRQAENKILSAEMISSILLKIRNEKYPVEEMKNNWLNILFNQFHDILAGSSIPEAYFDCLNILGETMFKSQTLINEKLWILSKNINTEKKDAFPILFFNPTSFQREEVKEISFQPRFNFIYASEVDFFDKNGKRTLSQTIIDPNSNRHKFLIKVSLPPFGYKVYWWKPGKKRDNKNLKLLKNGIENQKLFLKTDKKGEIKNLILKDKNWDVFKNYGFKFTVIDDPSDAWGHFMDSFRKVEGSFKFEEIIKKEKGECKVSLITYATYNNSEIVVEYSLYDNLPYLEVKGKINWQEKKKFLKISFPFNLSSKKILCEIPMAFIEREPDGKEHPFQRWIKIIGNFKGDLYSTGIINDRSYGYDFDGNELRISLLRSPRFAFHHSNSNEKEKVHKESDYIDIGISRFKLWIIPGNKNINIEKYAEFLNREIEYILPLSHKGSLPAEKSFINVEKENIILETLKKAEDDNSLILRLYESSGRKTQTSLKIFGKKFKLNFGKFEIKTLKIKNKEIKEVNLTEKCI